VIFGFRKRDDDIEEEEEIELVLFQGALNGEKPNLKANARLVDAGLVPAKELVTDSLARRAETIRIEPKGERSAVTLLIDGVAYPGSRLSKQQGLAITQVMKLLSGLDIKERTKPQSGGLNAEFQELPYELYVDSTPVAGGRERLTIRAKNLKEKLDTPEELGFSDDLKAKIREMTADSTGLTLVCGPPRAGVTTTVYGVLRSLDAYLYAIFTIVPGGRNLINITPFEGNPGDSLDETLKRIIRVDAQVVFVPPITDSAIAKTLFGLQEKLALITELPAKDAASGIAKLYELTGDPKIVAEGLRGMISPKLLRKLCDDCKEGYRPNPKLLEKVGLPKSTRVLYRPFKFKPVEPARGEEEVEPCEKCGGLGYYGRAAMFEYIEMTDSMRKLVAAGKPPAELKAQARKENMPTLQQDGLRLVAEGKTSLEELQRVFKAE
jgi:type II secretory ATPase GspE/PulE/Tfp pilus assembly ATPase PilB-like protein